MQTETLLHRRLFLVSVCLLLLNDFYLKAQFHNILTGKLSDFSGLFAFSYFFSVVFKKHIKTVYVVTAILFVFWKSSASQPFIDFVNSFGIGTNRVIDYSDLMALAVLPLSYWYRAKKPVNFKILKWLPKPLIIGTCLFAFVATTLLTETTALGLKSDYQVLIDTSKDDVLKTLQNIYKVNENSKYHTLVVVPKKRSTVLMTMQIIEQEADKTLIKLDSIKSFTTRSAGVFLGGVKKKYVDFVNQLQLQDFEQLFIDQKINKLNKKQQP